MKITRFEAVRIAALVCLLLSGAAPARATDNNFPTPGGATADGKVSMCLNSAGQAVPYDQSGGCPAGAPSPTSLASLAIAPVVGGTTTAGVVVKASPGNLYDGYAVCTAACWLMVFNSITVPADGATTPGAASGNLQECIPIAAGGIASLGSPGSPPESFSVGISAVISSTACATKTAAATGIIHIRAK